MFVAHAPAAWLLFRRQPALWAGVAGGLAPDLDMLLWLATGGRVHHHAYPSHWPLVWAAIVVIGFAVGGQVRRAAPSSAARRVATAVLLFGAGGLLHMLLDTVAGDVRWLAPFSDRAFSLVTVPATQPHWILSFLFHWTFAVELSICAVAVGVALYTPLMRVWRNWQTRRA